MEKRYESDLTRKEKRQLEYEKIKGMGWKKRIEYFFNYYKFVLVILVVIACLISMGVTMYRNAHQISVLSLAIVDANYGASENFELLEQDLLEYMGTGDKHEVVMLDTSASSPDEDYNMAMKLMVIMAGGTTDVMVVNEDLCKQYADQEAFQDWKEVLGEDYAKYEAYMVDGFLDMSQSEKWTEGSYTLYTPALACIVGNTENLEGVKAFAEYFFPS